MSLEAEKQLRERSLATGSKTIGHAADVLQAERLLVSSKDLGDRFTRIAKRLEELRQASPGVPDISQFQQQMESLRPLLRLLVRSDEFRGALISALRVATSVVDQNMEGSLDKVMKKGEKEGIEAAGKEVGKAVNETMENIEKKVDNNENIISDTDWEKLSTELDSLFHKFQQHSEFRDGINQLFALASAVTLASYVAEKSTTVQSVQRETKDLVAQFSGEEELDRLTRSINGLIAKLQNNSDALNWWAEFRDHTLHITGNYRGKEDLDKYRDIFRNGFKIFREHKSKIGHIIERMNIVISNIANDKLILRLRESLAALSDDLFWQDQDGNRYFDTEAGGVLASSVGDVIRNQFRYLALPKVVRKEEDMSFTLDNLVISANLPDKINFHLESYASLDTSALPVPGRSALRTEIYLTATIRGITALAPNLAFTYQGTTISDSGMMSVTIEPPGADLTIDFVLKPSVSTTMERGATLIESGAPLRYDFVRIKSHFHIPDMKIEFDTRTLHHNILVPLMTSLFKARIIDRFESGIEASLDQGLVALGQQVTSILNQAANPLSISSFGAMMTVV